MSLNVVALTQDLIAQPSVSTHSNAAISDFLVDLLQKVGFVVERLSYDDQGQEKVSVVARIGEGEGGLGLFSHSDTVPGEEDSWSPFDPRIENGRLFGRGSCDMKGPLAATIVAASQIDARRLRHPLTIVVTADEEVGYGGAYQVANESRLLAEQWPSYGVVAEPTQLRPVYAHKGGVHIAVTAHGVSAHTSTDKGISANFLIAPFLAEMAELRQRFLSDTYFQNPEFDPPTNGFNLVINDGNCKLNVTASKTVASLSLRTMPNDHREEAIELILAAARAYGLETKHRGSDPFYVSPESEIVKMALAATGLAKAETVPFGTEALVYQKWLDQQVILGPGNIAQAHTVGEWIDLAQLEESVGVYRRLIEQICCE